MHRRHRKARPRHDHAGRPRAVPQHDGGTEHPLRHPHRLARGEKGKARRPAPDLPARGPRKKAPGAALRRAAAARGTGTDPGVGAAGDLAGRAVLRARQLPQAGARARRAAGAFDGPILWVSHELGGSGTPFRILRIIPDAGHAILLPQPEGAAEGSPVLRAECDAAGTYAAGQTLPVSFREEKLLFF